MSLFKKGRPYFEHWTPYEGSLALPYKDRVRTGPDTSLLRTAVPVELPSYWLFVHNWTDWLHPQTKQPPYDFLNLYGACLHAPRSQKNRYVLWVQLVQYTVVHTGTKPLLIKLRTVSLVKFKIYILVMNSSKIIQIISLIWPVKVLSFHYQVFSDPAPRPRSECLVNPPRGCSTFCRVRGHVCYTYPY